MESRACFNGFELFGHELGVDADEVKARIKSDPKQTSALIKSKSLAALPLILGNDLTLRGSEAAFISQGSNLWDHLEKYFHHIHREAEFLSSPLIESSREINVYLQEKIGERLRGITDRIFTSTKFGRVFEPFEKLKDMKLIAQEFATLASKYLSSQQLISGFISALACQSGADLVEESARAAFVAMAILRHYHGADVPHLSQTTRRIVDLGMAVLFQDVTHITDNSEHEPGQPAHAHESAQIAREMGLPEICQETIRNHHRMIDAQGRPIMTEMVPPLEERIAVVTNTFMLCVSEKYFHLDPDQAVYVLEHYANRQFYDKQCVRTLGTIGIGDRKYAILSKSFEYANHCDKQGAPYIWNISTDFPNRFICRRSECEHLSQEEVILYQPIRFKATLQDLEIPKGRYRKCEKITRLFNLWLLNTFF
jgi:hypothetical protein